MAKAASAGLSLQRPGKISGRQLITMYLGPTAIRGELSNAILPGGCSVAAGVDVFAASPNALPFQPSHTGPHGEVWGYFAAARMAERFEPAPGGGWVLRGGEKQYVLGGETFGTRSRFAFHLKRVDGDGWVTWVPAPTRWMMKEYRLNKNAAMFRDKKLECPQANLDFVIRKVFTKPAVPPLQPAGSGEALQQGVVVRAPSSQAQPRKVPVKASVLAVRKDSANTKTKKALQQGGSSLPPRSARPPRPRPPMAQLLAKPVVPPPPAQFTATAVAPSPPAQVIAKPVAPPRPPKVIETPVAPPPPPQVIVKLVAPLPPPALSSQDEATSSREQPDKPNGKPLRLQTPPALGRGMFKVPNAHQLKIIAAHLCYMAVNGQLPRSVTPGYVAEGVDVFAVNPDTLPFPPSNRKKNGKVWGYFFAATPTTTMRRAHGGCWMQYGHEKKYGSKRGEVIAFRCRFAFHAAQVDGDGVVAWEQTRWLMKEYRVNQTSPFIRNARKGPGANMDLVVLKVFTKPMVPPPPPPAAAPACFSEPENAGSNYHRVNEGAGCSIAGGPSATRLSARSPY